MADAPHDEDEGFEWEDAVLEQEEEERVDASASWEAAEGPSRRPADKTHVDDVPRGHELRVHKTHLLLLLHRGRTLDRIACGQDSKHQDVAQALEQKLQSVDAAPLRSILKDTTKSGEDAGQCTNYAQMAVWIRRTFRRIDASTPHERGKTLHLHQQMLQAIRRGTEDEEFLVQLFVACCRRNRRRARIVHRLLPAMDEARSTPSKTKRPRLERKEKETVPWHTVRKVWAEVWSEQASAWDSVDVMDGRFYAGGSQLPTSAFAQLPSKTTNQTTMGYIFAFENGTVRDLGWKYNKSNHATSPSRKDGRLASHVWVQKSLRSLLPKHEEEEDALARRSQPIPNTLRGLKNHPCYVLECHLGKYEGIKPGGRVLGLCKGMPVYSTNDIAFLHTASRWVQEGRKVREEELSRPYKVVRKQNHDSKSRGTAQPTDSADDVEGQDIPKSILYGIWQTDPYVAGKVSDSGKIPTNRFGCIEVYGAFSLPMGTQHVNVPRASSLARKLGLEHAPAMVGWERRKGQNVPKFEGVVVLQEQAQLLQHAAQADAELRARRELEKKLTRAREGWHTLLSTLWTRQRLECTETVEKTGGSACIKDEDIEYL